MRFVKAKGHVTNDTTSMSKIDRPISPLFRGRFAPLAAPLEGATLNEITLYVPNEAAFVALHSAENAFVARIFWNTVLNPILSAYHDAAARQRECAEVETMLSTIRTRMEAARTDANATTEALLQHGREYDQWSRILDARRSALNHAASRFDTLFPQQMDENRIHHVSVDQNIPVG